MKQDPWKTKIDENREAFDQRKPKDLWASIEKELDKTNKKQPKTIELWKVYRVAAILVVVFGVAFFALNDNQAVQQAQVEIKKQETKEQSYPLELLEVENFYVSEIDEKLEEVKELMDDNLAMQEIQILKEEFDKLESEMGDQVNDEKIIDAMIQNYRLRLNLLKEILQDLKSDEISSQPTKYESKSI